MAPVFDSGAQLIDCKPNSGPDRYGETRWLLWPVWAWKVALPLRRVGGLDVFQHHILLMCQSGVRHAAEIGKRLDIGGELAAFILSNLIRDGYLGDDASIAARGVQYFKEDQESVEELLSGYVFRDAHSNQMWPRFILNTPRYVSTAGDGHIGKFAKIERGTPGSPASKLCRVIWPQDKRAPQRPSVSHIRKAFNSWRRAHSAWDRVNNRAGRRWDGEPEQTPFLASGPISVLAGPVPVFASTFLFLPEDLSASTLWQVCDPFGLGVSPRLRARLESMIDNGNVALREELGALTQTLEVGADEVRSLHGQRAAKATAEVTEQLTNRDCPERLAQVLAQVLVAQQSVEAQSGDGDTARKERGRALRALVRRAWEACELLLEGMTEIWAEPGLAARLGKNSGHNAELLAHIAERLGYQDDSEMNSQRRLLLVSGGELKGVLEYDNRSLPAMLAAGLLATADHPDHPLHSAARSMPELLIFFDELKRLRDPVAHQGAIVSPDVETEWVIAGIFKACNALLPATEARHTSKSQPSRHVPSPGLRAEDIAHRLRAQAVRDVEAEFSLQIRGLPDLRRELIRLSRNSNEARMLNENSLGSDHLLKDVLISGGAVLEAAMAALIRAESTPTWARTLTKPELRAAGMACLEELEVEPSEDLKAILRAKPQRVRRAMHSHRGPLPTLILVTVLATRGRPNHPLRRILEQNPDFLLRLAAAAMQRGHGDRALSRRATLAFADDVRQLCLILLPLVA